MQIWNERRKASREKRDEEAGQLTGPLCVLPL